MVKELRVKWNKSINKEFLDNNPTGTVSEFAKFVRSKEEKKYPRMYYAGSPMHETGDIIFQEFKDGPKTKLPVCTTQDLIPGQLIELYPYKDEYEQDQFDLFLFELNYGIKVYKNTYSNNYIVRIDQNSEKKLEIDKTIPSWVYVKGCK